MPQDVELDSFPSVPVDNRPRPLYFDLELTKLSEESLKLRGYEIIQLKTLPRRNDAEHMRYLLARLAGIDEGTVIAAKEDRLRLALELQAYGMLNPKTTRVNLNVTGSVKELHAILGWERNRHTLRDNTTIVGVSELDLHTGGEGALEKKRKLSLEKLQQEHEVFDAKVSRRKGQRSDKASPPRPVPGRKPRKAVGKR